MYVKVNAKTGMRTEEVKEVKEHYFDISVREKAERNMANTRILELVAMYYHVPKAKVRIINGHHHPSKLIRIDLG
jgi:uncharacterized protein YggU (UPF0235/DUF167 family)